MRPSGVACQTKEGRKWAGSRNGMVNGMVFYHSAARVRSRDARPVFDVRHAAAEANRHPVANLSLTPSRRSAWPTHPLCMTVCAAILIWTHEHHAALLARRMLTDSPNHAAGS